MSAAPEAVGPPVSDPTPELGTAERGALLVGIDDAPPVPMQQGSPEAGDFRGYEVDLLDALAHRFGATLRYRRAYWSAIVDDLAAGRVDAVCSAATVTPERARAVDFCTPHLALTLAVVARAGDAAGTSLSGRRVGVRRGTTAEAYARAHGAPAPAARSESNDALYAALAAGALPDTEAAYAIMVRQGNDALRGAFDAALAALEADGTLGTLRARWGLSVA